MPNVDDLKQRLDWLGKNMKRVRVFRENVADAAADDIVNCADEDYLVCLRNVFLKETNDPRDVFSALFGWDIYDMIDRVEESFEVMKKYRIELSLANLRHKPWWVWGDIPQVYEFDSLNTVMCFLTDHNLVRQQDMEFITKQDARLETGRLSCTSWYTITKGEEGMTEYTSL